MHLAAAAAFIWEVMFTEREIIKDSGHKARHGQPLLFVVVKERPRLAEPHAKQGGSVSTEACVFPLQVY